MAATVADYAAAYVRKYGLTLIPLPPKTKRPLQKEWGLKDCLTTPEAAREYYERNPSWNIGVALGPSRLVTFDVDNVEAMQILCDEFGWDLETLRQQVPTVQGKAPNYRMLFRAPDGWEFHRRPISWPNKLDPDGSIMREFIARARAAEEAGDLAEGRRIRDIEAKPYKRVTVFEIRGAMEEQLQDVLPPSIHPDTGREYIWLTKPNGTIPEPPAWLLSLWQNWEALKPQLQGLCPWAPAPPPKPRKAAPRAAGEPSVIDAYDQAHDIESALARYGYRQQGRRWLSPHSSTGLAGVVVFDGKAWIHHASDPLCSDESGQLVGAFDLFRYYEHGGDIGKAVKAAAEELGMKPARRQLPAPSSASAVPMVTDPDTGEILPLAPEFSDDAMALEFVAIYGAGLRWTPGMGWMHDQTTHWVRDEHLIRYDLARKTARRVAQDADPKARKAITSAKAVNSILFLAQSDPAIVVPATQWDNDPLMLNTPAGIVDLRTGKTAQRNREQYLTQITRISAYEDVEIPNWLRFISQVFAEKPDVIEFVQRMCGYCLSGDRREQKLFFAHGQGSNGKSTLLDILMWMMGSYALKLPTSALMMSKNERHPTELAQLHGKRLAVSNELEEGAFWAEARIKELTGDETLTARFMRQDNFTFFMTHKHLIAGNHKPRLKGGDPAMARRMVLLPFEQKFEGDAKDPKLPEKLKAEAPGILAWAVRGALKWHADGLAIPGRVEQASKDYMADHDDIAMWVGECCETASGMRCRSGDLYQSFRRWKQSRGEHEPSQTVWSEKMTLLPGLQRIKSDGVMVWKGIDLTGAEKAKRDGWA